MTRSGIDAFLKPRSIAVLGASAHEGKIGNIVVRQLAGKGFTLYPVNPKGGSVEGIPILRSLREAPEAPELAVLTLPAEAAVPAAAECVERGVRGVIAIAGGFGETGEEGRKLEAQLADVIKGSHTRLLGPNTLGVLSPGTGLDTVFLSPERFQRPGAGALALISQSGSAVLGELDNQALHGITISAFVGLGNRLDVDEEEWIRYFADDPASTVIGLYLESFSDATQLLDTCERVVATKPIVLLKAGCSESGARAVQLHTGSLAGSDQVTDGALRQAGILRVRDCEELLDVGRTLAYARPLEGRNVAVLTNGGGWGILAADCIESKEWGAGLRLARLTPETTGRLGKVTLPYAALRNPVDVTASADNKMFADALEILQDAPEVDAVLCTFGFQPPAIDERLTDVLCHYGKSGRKPLVVSLMGSESAMHSLRRLEATGVPAYPSTKRAVRAIAALAQRGEYLRRRRDGTQTGIAAIRSRGPEIDDQFRPGTPLAEDEVKALLRARGIATPNGVVLDRGLLPETLYLAYPLALKVRSAAILHKTDRGGVMLDIKDRPQLETAVEEMRSRFPGEDLLAEEMEPKGVELIVGLISDPTFGLSIMCGIGGVLAELYRDVTFRRLPIDRIDADEMIGELNAHAILEGFRGIKASREAVVELLLRVSALGVELGEGVDQLDLNPVIVHEDGAVVVDAKLLWKW
ncbi:MAG TPA: acetate--CoA ligase family protein [Chloroflexota bacterium]|nr:acetate--CoA ligase family protein [Chloroflexota bacterium]